MNKSFGIYAICLTVLTENYGFVQRLGRACLATETFQCLRVSGNVIRQELEGDKATKVGVRTRALLKEFHRVLPRWKVEHHPAVPHADPA